MSGIVFTKNQERIIQLAVDWYFNSPEQIFQFAGNPGTGKSVVLDEILSRIRSKVNIAVAPMAYVGAAAVNMRMKGMLNAKTIHSWLYEVVEVPLMDRWGNQIRDKYFNVPLTEFQFRRNKDINYVDLLVIDEGGTVPDSMRQDILDTGKKILVCGDLDQLEPVGGPPAFLVSGKVHVLTEIMRQAEGSAIVWLCQRAKAGLPIHCGNYGDCLVVQRHEVTKEMLAYANIILCSKNATREHMNNYFRKEILGVSGPLPHLGEKIICKKNNWSIEAGGVNLTNGMAGIVMNEPDVSSYNKRLFTVDFNPILTNHPFYDLTIDYDYFVAPHARKQEIRMMKRPKEANQFDFGYAQTVHTAQGSQWNTGIYFEEYMHDIDRINYTALSRFSHSCIFVKNDAKYYTGVTLI